MCPRQLKYVQQVVLVHTLYLDKQLLQHLHSCRLWQVSRGQYPLGLHHSYYCFKLVGVNNF
jgi:hypothetical protein